MAAAILLNHNVVDLEANNNWYKMNEAFYGARSG